MKWEGKVTNKNILILSFIFICVVTYTSILCFFMCTWVTVHPPVISAWRTPFSISCKGGSTSDEFLVAVYLGMSLFLFYRLVLLDIEFPVDWLFIPVLWLCHSTPSGFNCFGWEINYQSYWSFLVCNKSFLFCCFQDSPEFVLVAVCLMTFIKYFLLRLLEIEL